MINVSLLQRHFSPELLGCLKTEWHTYGKPVFTYRDDFFTFRHPSDPGIYEENCLYLLRPERHDLAGWLARFREHFPEDPYRHVVLLMVASETAAALAAQAPDHGLSSMGFTFMHLHEPPPEVPVPEGFVIRRVTYPEDTERMTTFNVETFREEEWYENDDAIVHLTNIAIERNLRLGIETFCVSPAGSREIVAKAGIFALDGVCRYQNIGTHPEYRRRGLCRALTNSVARYAFTRWQPQQVIMFTELDSVAHAIYRGIGFRDFAEKITQIHFFPGSP